MFDGFFSPPDFSPTVFRSRVVRRANVDGLPFKNLFIFICLRC